MPLLICTVVFAVLFLEEGLWFLADASLRESDLERYQSVEHPRRKRADSYIDAL